METNNYPGVSIRVKAVVTDSIILVTLMLGVTYLFEHIGEVPDFLRLLAFVFIFILYDPLFTSTLGGTVGHMLFGIQVKREEDQDRNILFPLAIIRYIVKVCLGWVSLLTISEKNKGKAIHDLLVRSVVIFKD